MSTFQLFDVLFGNSQEGEAPIVKDNSLPITITPEYGYVLLVAGFFFFTNLGLGASVMSYRKQYFTSEKLQTFFDQHKKAFDYDPKSSLKFGYPDMGNGKLAQKALTYEEWFRFNCAQRGHQNFLESAWSALALMLIGGLFAPTFYAGCGFAYCIGRILYFVGYTSNMGPKGREIGAIMGLLSNFSMAAYAMKLGYDMVTTM